MKERILVPVGLQRRLEALVKAYAKDLATTEGDARRVVEVAVFQRGLDALEQDRREAGPT